MKNVKLLLHFESLNFGEGIVKEYLKNRCVKRGIFNEDVFNNLFFIEISEFEELVQIISEDENVFYRIIEKKFELNDIKSIAVGKEFYIPIQEFSDKREVDFLEKQFSEYESFIKVGD